MNDDDRLTPEERKLIEAALEGAGLVGTPNMFDHDQRLAAQRRLVDAADAYRKATAPPEPFEAFLRWTGDEWEKDGGQNWPMISLDPEQWFKNTDGVWRCTVTPTERVRR